jgi:hypothetical protein
VVSVGAILLVGKGCGTVTRVQIIRILSFILLLRMT